jgi:hypothetical protein
VFGREEAGSGRAKLRLSRGLPDCPAHDVTPQKSVPNRHEKARGASPYLNFVIVPAVLQMIAEAP